MLLQQGAKDCADYHADQSCNNTPFHWPAVVLPALELNSRLERHPQRVRAEETGLPAVCGHALVIARLPRFRHEIFHHFVHLAGWCPHLLEAAVTMQHVDFAPNPLFVPFFQRLSVARWRGHLVAAGIIAREKMTMNATSFRELSRLPFHSADYKPRPTRRNMEMNPERTPAEAGVLEEEG